MLEAMFFGAITGWLAWAGFALVNDWFDLDGSRAFRNRHLQ
jgi:hypothetical protein